MYLITSTTHKYCWACCQAKKQKKASLELSAVPLSARADKGKLWNNLDWQKIHWTTSRIVHLWQWICFKLRLFEKSHNFPWNIWAKTPKIESFNLVAVRFHWGSKLLACWDSSATKNIKTYVQLLVFKKKRVPIFPLQTELVCSQTDTLSRQIFLEKEEKTSSS